MPLYTSFVSCPSIKPIRNRYRDVKYGRSLALDMTLSGIQDVVLVLGGIL